MVGCIIRWRNGPFSTAHRLSESRGKLQKLFLSLGCLSLLPGWKKGNMDDAMRGDQVQQALEDLSEDIFQIVWDLLVGFFSRIICSDQREGRVFSGAIAPCGWCDGPMPRHHLDGWPTYLGGVCWATCLGGAS